MESLLWAHTIIDFLPKSHVLPEAMAVERLVDEVLHAIHLGVDAVIIKGGLHHRNRIGQISPIR